jgi:tyrosyl-tRNA synthetase
LADIQVLKTEASSGRNPRDIKIELAMELIARFHSKSEAEAAHQDFIQRFSQQEIPDDIAEISLDLQAGMPLAQLLKQVNLVATTSEAYRMLDQGAVKADGEKINDRKCEMRLQAGDAVVLQVGRRRFIRIAGI